MPLLTRHPRLSLFLLLFMVLVLFLTQYTPSTWLAAASPPFPENTGGPDTFGYTYRDSAEPDGPTYNWVDISSTGTNAGITGNSNHGPLPLGFTFNFYGNNYTDVWMSSEGWLSIGAATPASDESNDCPLPSQNGNENIIGGIWDNLNALITTPNGQGYYQSFPVGSCPYNGYPGACFIAQWQNTYYDQFPLPPFDSLTFQIILLDNHDGVVQIQNAGTRAGSGSTTGIENSTATDGLVYACNEANSLSNNSAIQFYFPGLATRFDYSYKQGPVLSQPNSQLAYTVVITNAGNIPATNTVMTDTIPAGTTYVPGSVSCVGGTTTLCTFDAGNNQIRWEGGMGVREQVTVTYSVNAGGSCGDVLVNQAVISDPNAAASPIVLPYTTTLANEFTLYNFEANNGGFAATNDWQYGIPTWPIGLHAHSGDRLWATVLDGYYNNLGASSLLTRTINLAGLPSNARLMWWQYLKTNNNLFDVGRVRLNGNEIYNSAGADELIWTQHTASLAPYVGGNLNLEFDFFSTLSINNDGWYLDDVAVYYCTPQPTPNFNFSTKSALPIAITGKTLAYSVILDNFSTVAAPSTTLVDPIPAGTTYVAGSATNGAVYNSTLNQIEWSGTVPANGQVEITFLVTVAAAPGTLITNTATINQPSLSQPVIVDTTTRVVTTQAADYPTCTTFETGILPAYMFTEVTQAGNSIGRAVVSDLYPHTGNFAFNLDTNDPSGTGANVTQQAGIIVADLTGATDVALSFWIRGHADEDDPEDGVFISDDGGLTYVRIYNPPADIWFPYQSVILNLSDAVTAAGMDFTSSFLIKFQSKDNYAIALPPFTSDGYSYDDICLEAVAANVEVNPSSLSTTQLNDVQVTRTLTISSSGTDTLAWQFTVAPNNCATPGSVNWLSTNPVNGSTPPGNTANVTVTFDSTGLPLGNVFTGNLCLNSNDPNEPIVQIPVTMTVTSPPTILVTPDPLTATVFISETTQVTLTITNLGFTPLNWYLWEGSSMAALHGPGAIIFGPDGNTDQLMVFNSNLSQPLAPLGPLGTADYAAAEILSGDPLHLYAINNLNQLFRISLVNAAATQLATLPLPTGFLWSGMAVHPTTGVVYASATNCNNSSRLYTLDISAGTATLVGNISTGNCITDIAVNSEGQMYGVDEAANNLLSINRNTGAAAIIGALGYNAANGQGLDFDDATGILYLAALQPGPISQLRTVNLATGATTIIGNLTDGSNVNRLGDIAVVSNSSCIPGDIPWATFNLNSGTVGPDSSTQVVVTLAAAGLSPGVHEGTICVFSDDITMPQVTVTLRLTVEEKELPPPPTETKIYLPFVMRAD
ncbi:MAG: DUF11 domain-containing protein [Anaerolineae bacterium]|nr:DUF11 domain-containing protein [Anaerolineae bacterium]